MPAAERVGVESYFGISDFTKNTLQYVRILDRIEKRTADYGKSVERSTTGAEQSWQDYVRVLMRLTDVQQREINELRGALIGFQQQNEDTTKRAESGWKSFAQSTMGQVMKFKATIDMARYGLQAFIKPFQVFIGLGTQAVGMQRTTQRFADMVGGVEEYKKAIEGMREVTMGQISDANLISGAFEMMRRGYADTAESAALLNRNITLAAQAAGQYPSPEAALQVFALMMSNQSKMRLDAFGITIEQHNAKMRELKETYKGMSDEELFKMAVIENLNANVESLGLTVETSQTRLNKMTVEFQNLGNSVKTVILPLFDDFVNSATWMANQVNVNAEAIGETWAKVVGSIRGYILKWGDALSALVFKVMEFSETIKGNTEEAQRYNELYAQAEERWRSNASVIDAVNYELERQRGLLVDNASAMSEQTQAIDNAVAAYERLMAAQQGISTGIEEIMSGEGMRLAAKMEEEFYAADKVAREAAERQAQIAEQTAQRLMAIQAQLSNSIAQAIASHGDAILRAQEQLAERRKQIEENYQKAIRAIQQRYEMDEYEAERTRDALALVNARRRRDQELDNARQARDEQMADADEAYNKQVQTAEQALERQIQAAKDAYNQQLMELENNLREQEQKQREAQQKKEAEQALADARELGKLRQQQGQKIAEMYLANQAELTAAKEQHTAMLAQMSGYADQMIEYYRRIGDARQYAMGGYNIPVVQPAAGPKAEKGLPSKQAGGYTPGGVIQTHPGEFVLNRQTTKALEQVMGALSQTKLQTMAVGSQRGITGPSSVQHNVAGEISGTVEVVVSRAIEGMEGRITAALRNNMRGLFRM